MLYLTLDQIKKHLNIDPWYTDDDEYLAGLAQAAQLAVELHIDFSLKSLAESNGGELPAPLLQAMLLMIGNMYANREAVSYAAPSEVPLAYNYLISLYQNYGPASKYDSSVWK